MSSQYCKACVYFTLCCIFMVLAVEPSHAEVCDKMTGETWRSEDGIWWPWLYRSPLRYGVLFGFIFLFWRARLRTVTFASGALLVTLGIIDIWSWRGPESSYDLVWQSAIQEGCASRVFGIAGGMELIMMGLILFAVGYKLTSTHAVTLPRK